MKFLVHSLPRSGSKMLCHMLNSHPDLSVQHEYRGTKRKLLELGHDGILCQWQHLPAWTWDEDLIRIHLTREYRAAACSQLLMNNQFFINGTYDLPVWAVDELAEQRADMDHQLLQRITPDMTITYEEITCDTATEWMPTELARHLLAILGEEYHDLRAPKVKFTKRPRNYEECLRGE
jgi:hypothetical protein